MEIPQMSPETYSHASIIFFLERTQSLNPSYCSASSHSCRDTAQIPPLSHTVFTDAPFPQLAYENATANGVRALMEVKIHHLTFSVFSTATMSINLSFFLTNIHWLQLTTLLFFNTGKAWTFVPAFFWRRKSGWLLCPAHSYGVLPTFSPLSFSSFFYDRVHTDTLQPSVTSFLFLFIKGLTLKPDNNNQTKPNNKI